LTTVRRVGILANVKAELLRRQKSVLSDGAILELVIWRVPHPVEGCEHCYKYRLYYGRKGERLVGYDNERGKGDHRHRDGLEAPYSFSTVDALVRDFLTDVEKRRKK
jgi:hypothetical protein